MFSNFIDQLSETNVDLSFFVDFNKAKVNVSQIEIHLNTLNYLLGKSPIDAAIDELYASNPHCFSVLGILIAVRPSQGKVTLNRNSKCVPVESYFQTADDIKEFFVDTGLKELFEQKGIKNLVDYVFGVEVGLDTHARKNRGGKYMERAFRGLLKNHDIIFSEQKKTDTIPKLAWVGGDFKQFDFYIETPEVCYLIETNFYSSGGSKLSETARSYANLSNLIEPHDGFEFVWVTDGFGWHTAKNSLESTFNKMGHLYNLRSVEPFLSKVKEQQSQR